MKKRYFANKKTIEMIKNNLEKQRVWSVDPGELTGLNLVECEYIPDDQVIAVQEQRASFVRSQVHDLCSEWAWYEFSCPFDFLSEFDKWFEWHAMVHFDNVPSWRATGVMTNWNSDIFERCRIDQFRDVQIRAFQNGALFRGVFGLN